MIEIIDTTYAIDTAIAAEPTLVPTIQPYNPLVEMARAYGEHYREFTSHSPEASRVSLIRRARPAIAAMGPSGFMLDIGSGPQALEKQYKLAYGNPVGRFITIDISPITKKGLLLGKNSRTTHIRGNGRQLSLADDSMDVVIANMVLDFTGKDGLEEVYRVTKPGGRIYANLCFSYLDYIRDVKETAQTPSPYNDPDPKLAHVRRREEPSFWLRYLQHEPALITNPADIGPMFKEHGFFIDAIKKAESYGTTWWEIDMHKPTPEELEKFRDIQKGKLIARLIALAKDSSEEGRVARDKSLKSLAQFGNDDTSRPLTRFVTQLRSHDALLNRKPFVDNLLAQV